MKRVVAVLGAGAMAMGLTAGPASADVHAISQAACAPDGVLSGAIMSRNAVGRPGAPIPVTASPFETTTDFPGKGGAAGAGGTNCP